MADRTCSVDGCETKAHTRGWCNKHYKRWYKHGDPNYTSERTDPQRHRGERCGLEGCESARVKRDWCETHYQQWHRYGDPAHPLSYRLDVERQSHAGKVCAADGCDRPRRKRQWCANHYTHWRNHGDVETPYHHKWADEQRCVVCGSTEWNGKGRRFCSPACQQIYMRHGTERPTSVDCALCATEIDLTTRGKAGRLKRSDTALCERCKPSRSLRHKTPVRVVANRDGTDCGICREPVDLDLRWPDPMSASVDHVIPRARGGSDDLSNLQVAHLTCNLKKHTRIAA